MQQEEVSLWTPLDKFTSAHLSIDHADVNDVDAFSDEPLS